MPSLRVPDASEPINTTLHRDPCADLLRPPAQQLKGRFDNFMRQENRGKALFMRNCSTCHMKDGNEYFFARRQPILDREATTRRPTAAT